MLDTRTLKTEPGVYAIRFLLDKRTYIGSSKNVRKRIQNHLSSLRKGKHHSVHLQRAYDKYGEGYFEVFAFGYYEVDSIRSEEQFWLDNATCSFNGSRLANRPSHTPETVEQMRIAGREIWQRQGYREKMKAIPRKGNLGYKPTEQAVANMREAHRAKHRTVQAFGKLWSIKELAETYGVKYTMLKDRIQSGWSAEKAVLTPKRKGGL